MATTKDNSEQKIKINSVQPQKRKTDPNKRPQTDKSVPKKAVSKKKKRKKKRSKKGCLIFIIFIVVIALLGKLVSGYLDEDMSSGGEVMEISLEIPENSSVSDIADLLEENNVIDSATHFKVLCKMNSEGSNFKSGYYVFTNDMMFNDLVKLLSSGAASINAKRLTVKEGMWLTEIADAVAQTGVCTKEEFLKAANSRDYDYDFIKDIPNRDNLLEGYLYPDTYFLEEGMTAETIVNMLLGEFNKHIVENDIISKAKKKGKTLDEIVTIASLIEGEVKVEDERPVVASVIYNRLDSGTKLQIDASVIYSLGERVTRVYEKNYKNEENHNTYYVKGLPEGPINNPRIASIIAACEPADTKYIYYVVEDLETGKHHFSEDYDEFLKAKEKYLDRVN